jgi:hypothetical protein
MSTICLAAQRSFTTGEAVWFSWRLPSLKKLAGHTLIWVLGICAVLVAGLYAHTWWSLRHPAPVVKNVSITQPETQLSDMHYVYVSKPFPHPESHPMPAPAVQAMPPMEDIPINTNDADWQQAPGSAEMHDRDTLPGTEPHADPESPDQPENNDLKALFMHAMQEQEKDYSQGKIPAPPIDETQENARPPLSQKGDRLE